MECSICIATHNKAAWLERALDSVVCQRPGFGFETIVVDDNSNDDTSRICDFYSSHIRYHRLEHANGERNPSVARNVAYRLATGRVLICQSDEVVHITPDSVRVLAITLQPGTFTIATVLNTDINGKRVRNPLEILTGSKNQRPLFFLGALLRSDMYKAGGNDERYTGPGREDIAFGNSLIHGLGLRPRYADDIVGHHIDHPRPGNLQQLSRPSRDFYRKRYRDCSRGTDSWLSPSAPWEEEV